ncbi:MAG: hypothetical protein Q8M94_16030 [Ignavibacteria bacterium]|nr:hypothetical protein [Ignavibacteria bacterium]
MSPQILQISSINNFKILALTNDNQLFISTDSCRTWSLFTSKVVRKFCVDKMGNIFILTNKVEMSSDQGATWHSWPNGLPTSFTPNSFCAGDNGNLFYSTYEDGLLISTNFGESWASTSLKYDSPELVIELNQYLVALIRYGALFLSLDDGVTWKIVKRSIGTRGVISLIADSSEKLYISCSSSISDSLTIKLSKDFGETWLGIASIPDANLIFSLDSNVVFVSGNRSDIIWKLWKESSGWKKVLYNEGLPEKLILNGLLGSDRKLYLLLENGEIYRTLSPLNKN